MINYSTSKQLIKNTKNFIQINYLSIFRAIFIKKAVFYGWGNKKSGLKAMKLAEKTNNTFVLLEDGFIRSLGLGVDGSKSFSIVKDDLGIYYNAKTTSKLEHILNTYNFAKDTKLMAEAKEAIKLIKKYNISKYNNASDIDNNFVKKYNLNSNSKKILIITQTFGDASLKYGMLKEYTTDDIINTAIIENPDADIYIKIHPDVLSGKKKSDIDISKLKNKSIVLEENVTPIALLRYFNKVYTKTSQMGFEAILVGCECVCFGMPFYAGWGVTTDKVKCDRRNKKLSIEEIFAGAYILYSQYFNPYENKKTNLIDTIKYIVNLKIK
jgi:capsular polysaccharide export protein